MECPQFLNGPMQFPKCRAMGGHANPGASFPRIHGRRRLVPGMSAIAALRLFHCHIASLPNCLIDRTPFTPLACLTLGHS